MSTKPHTPAGSESVLIIEDEPDITRAYRRWLEDEYDVRVAHTGRDALDQLDGSVSIVLLDRRLPDTTGEELLPQIRENTDNCHIAIISTVEPDFDILDYGFDLYVEKPVTGPEEILEAVRTLERRASFDSKMQEYLSFASKKAALEANKTSQELQNNEDYEQLLDRIDALRVELDNVMGDLSDDDLRTSLS